MVPFLPAVHEAQSDEMESEVGSMWRKSRRAARPRLPRKARRGNAITSVKRKCAAKGSEQRRSARQFHARSRWSFRRL